MRKIVVPSRYPLEHESDVDPRIVSTDTHGTNQVNHAILDFFGYQFAPRYKHLDSEHRRIYGFHNPHYYQGMVIKPGRKIKEHLIIAEEDNIKRIIVSLALKSTTQSTIIRKLSSYDRLDSGKFSAVLASLESLEFLSY